MDSRRIASRLQATNHNIVRYLRTNKKGRLVFFTVSFLFFSHFPRAFAAEICPFKLDVTNEPAVTDKFGKWTNNDRYQRLTYIDFFSGLPQFRELILPTTQDYGQRVVNEWDFSSYDISQGVWISCHYSDEKIMLVYLLPKAFRACRIHYFAPNRIPSDGTLLIVDTKCW